MELLADFNTVTVYSELGVALAGFGMLGSIFKSKRGSDHPALDAFRLRSLVNGSAVLTLGGLFPFVLGKFPLPAPTIWRMASLFFFICLLIVIFLGVRGLRELKKQKVLSNSASRRALLVLTFSSLLILSLNLFVTNDHFLKGVYFSALTTHTAAGFLLFARVFSSLFKVHSMELDD